MLQSERRLAANPTTKSYLPIPGLAEYNEAVKQLIFGADSGPVTSAMSSEPSVMVTSKNTAAAIRLSKSRR